MTAAPKTRLLIVNDSPTVRAALRRALGGELDVIGEASDGQQAIDAVGELRPDVVLMDVVMPVMDGYAATRAVMARYPTPIVLYSAVVSPRDVAVAMESLRSGALSIAEALPAPGSELFESKRSALTHLLRALSQVNVHARAPGPRLAAARPADSRAVAAIGIASSTGGPQALDVLLRALPAATLPPILVVQHIASGFTEGFAQWLATTTSHRVMVATNGSLAERGGVYIAPEGKQLGIDESLHLTVREDPLVGVFRPSGTYLFHAMAKALGARAAGVVLTGMGSDGAEGLVALRRAGGATVVQDASTSVIFGMPRAALEAGGASDALPLEQLAIWLIARSA